MSSTGHDTTTAGDTRSVAEHRRSGQMQLQSHLPSQVRVHPPHPLSEKHQPHKFNARSSTPQASHNRVQGHHSSAQPNRKQPKWQGRWKDRARTQSNDYRQRQKDRPCVSVSLLAYRAVCTVYTKHTPQTMDILSYPQGSTGLKCV